MRSRGALAAAAALIVAATPAIALANGRFPAAFQLVQAPDDPDHLLVQVTYGFMSTRDRGVTWGWTCEKAIGFVGDIDPPIAITEGHVQLAALFDGLVRSSPDGCSWELVPTDTPRYAIDVSVSRSDPRDVVYLTSEGLGSDRFDTRVFRSGDAAATFTQVSDPVRDDFIAETIDVAPTDPDRIYVSGFFALGDGVYQGAFGRSDDGGATFTFDAIDGSDNGSGPFLAAVHPADADVLWVRLGGQGGRLLRSEDGGATFETIFEAEGTLQGFALSPDGATILVGGELDPVQRGPSDGGGFVPVSTVQPKCLTWLETGVYACGSEQLEGFTIGVSHDEGETFSSIYSRFCTEGPLDCPAGTSVGDVCDAEWVTTRPNIGADSCGEGGAGSSTSAVTTSVTTGGGAAAAGTGGGEDAPVEDDGGGCCTVAPGRSRPASSALAVAILGALALRARRRGR